MRAIDWKYSGLERSFSGFGIGMMCADFQMEGILQVFVEFHRFLYNVSDSGDS